MISIVKAWPGLLLLPCTGQCNMIGQVFTDIDQPSHQIVTFEIDDPKWMCKYSLPAFDVSKLHELTIAEFIGYSQPLNLVTSMQIPNHQNSAFFYSGVEKWLHASLSSNLKNILNGTGWPPIDTASNYQPSHWYSADFDLALPLIDRPPRFINQEYDLIYQPSWMIQSEMHFSRSSPTDSLFIKIVLFCMVYWDRIVSVILGLMFLASIIIAPIQISQNEHERASRGRH